MIHTLTKPNQKILVTGGTGFIGQPLCQALIDQGHSLTILTRSLEKAGSLFSGSVRLISALNHLDSHEAFDIVINLAGEPISQRWSQKAKARILESRLTTTKDLIAFLEKASHKPHTFISGSAIGIYGTSQDTGFDETTAPVESAISDFPREICHRWETEALKATKLGIRTCMLRTGVVLETGGGALAKMLFPFKFGLGGPMGSGQQWFSWIHLQDALNMIIHVINKDDITGPINVTAPTPVSNKVFSKALGKAMRRPTFLPLPAFHVRLLFGEMGQALLLNGQKVIPQKALDIGFQFQHPSVEDALKNIIRE